jgi:hypothetical protein
MANESNDLILGLLHESLDAPTGSNLHGIPEFLDPVAQQAACGTKHNIYQILSFGEETVNGWHLNGVSDGARTLPSEVMVESASVEPRITR